MTGAATMTPRWHEEVGFFELWFVVPEPLPGVRYVAWDAR